MPDRLRIYVDEHVPGAVVQGLRQRGVDVLTTADAQRLGATDAEQLALAARLGRVLYTQDADFLRLHASGAQHTGIAFARQGRRVGEVVRGLMRLVHGTPPAGMAGRIAFL